MPKLTITQGFPGSGKSTWTDQQVKASKGKIVGVNRDLLRMMTGRTWWPADERLVTVGQRAIIMEALSRDLDVICDDTFLRRKHVDEMERLAADLGAAFEVKSFMHVPLHTCIQRDAQRERSVGKDVIVRMYYDYWKQEPKPSNDVGPPAIICDIDGTLAHTDVPYPAAYHRDYMGDDVDPVVAQLVQMYVTNDFRILLVSGRSERHHEITRRWLAEHRIHFDRLFMRPEGDDKTDDATVKKRLFLDYIAGHFSVKLCLDDRPRVCRLWSAELGLKVLNVGDGAEF